MSEKHLELFMHHLLLPISVLYTCPCLFYILYVQSHLILTTVLLLVFMFHRRNLNNRRINNWPKVTQPLSIRALLKLQQSGSRIFYFSQQRLLLLLSERKEEERGYAMWGGPKKEYLVEGKWLILLWHLNCINNGGMNWEQLCLRANGKEALAPTGQISDNFAWKSSNNIKKGKLIKLEKLPPIRLYQCFLRRFPDERLNTRLQFKTRHMIILTVQKPANIPQSFSKAKANTNLRPCS